ncbi:TetR/AcrR family transcriptional regulator [Actinoallomurus acanthiterrae]
MSAHTTVDWSALRGFSGGEPPTGGLRERKKWLTRQRLTDTATEMFLERGFDAVRVAEIAEACGVSVKTVFNYFPTKETLILDRWEATEASLRTILTVPDLTPVEACLRVLEGELDALTTWLDAQRDQARAIAAVKRFGALIASTPALRAHQRDTTDRLTGVVGELLADRTATSPDAPEVRIVAVALLGLWEVQARSLRLHLGRGLAPARLYEAVAADVRRAATVLNEGIGHIEGPRPASG